MSSCTEFSLGAAIEIFHWIPIVLNESQTPAPAPPGAYWSGLAELYMLGQCLHPQHGLLGLTLSRLCVGSWPVCKVLPFQEHSPWLPLPEG